VLHVTEDLGAMESFYSVMHFNGGLPKPLVLRTNTLVLG
jgi:hypothetical protein